MSTITKSNMSLDDAYTSMLFQRPIMITPNGTPTTPTSTSIGINARNNNTSSFRAILAVAAAVATAPTSSTSLNFLNDIDEDFLAYNNEYNLISNFQNLTDDEENKIQQQNNQENECNNEDDDDCNNDSYKKQQEQQQKILNQQFESYYNNLKNNQNSNSSSSSSFIEALELDDETIFNNNPSIKSTSSLFEQANNNTLSPLLTNSIQQLPSLTPSSFFSQQTPTEMLNKLACGYKKCQILNKSKFFLLGLISI